MMDSVIKIGDEVSWRGAWGDDDVMTAKVDGITLSESPYCHVGEEVFSVKHSTLKEGKAIVDLDNGHWAYSNQIAPIGHEPTDWHKEI